MIPKKKKTIEKWENTCVLVEVNRAEHSKVPWYKVSYNVIP